MTLAAVVVAVILLLAAGWLRAAGTAVSRVPRADAVRDASEGRRGAAVIAELAEEREAIAPATGMVSTALLVMAAVLATAAIVAEEVVHPVVAAVIVGVTAFLAGDLIPRVIGRSRPRPIAYLSARLVRLAVRIGGWADEWEPEGDSEDRGEPGGALEAEEDEHERELIDSVLEFGETMVREVMTPRPDMVTIPLGSSVDELITLSTDEGYSRIPVVDDGDVVGLIIVKDLLPLLSDGQRPRIADVMRPAEFIPEGKLAASLLAEMQESHTHLMIVVDEYGDVSGLVTIEDLLEELVGEITDETDEEEVFVVSRGHGVWDVDARLPVEDLAELAGVELPDEDWDTVGGLILGLAERVPEEGESFEFEHLGLTVTKMQGRRISEVRVVIGRPAEIG